MHLYNTKVVPSAVDDLWRAPTLPDMSGARMLVISTAFSAGSAEEQTLQKMMAACKLSSAEYVVLQIEPGMPCSWYAIAASAPDTILLLGLTPAQLSIQALFRLHSPNSFSGRTIIPALSLAEIESNPAAKKDLWTSGLKPIFG